MTISTGQRHKARAKPGAGGGGRFFHIEVRPARNFVRFRVQALGGTGGIERVAGQRASGSWDTQKWLIRKDRAHVENGTLVPDAGDARELLTSLGSAARQVTGDRFKARPRRNVQESDQPTSTMRRARSPDIRKTQAARRTPPKGRHP
jgi:hypothetical protein